MKSRATSYNPASKLSKTVYFNGISLRSKTDMFYKHGSISTSSQNDIFSRNIRMFIPYFWNTSLQLTARQKNTNKMTSSITTNKEMKVRNFFTINNTKNSLMKENYKLINSDHNLNLYESLKKETHNHIMYLEKIGLGERAQGIQLTLYKDINHLYTVDLSPFTKRTSIPKEVIDFSPEKKNTLITTDSQLSYNKQEDLDRILDIRLYPPLKELIFKHGIEVFIGSKNEMDAYYKSKGSTLLFQFSIPSSATYYLTETANGEYRVVMAGLASKENIIAQLITLKLAKVKINEIEIIGDVEHFSNLVTNDIENMLNLIPEIIDNYNALIIAGCGLESTVSKIVMDNFKCSKESKSFQGDIVSLTYNTIINPKNEINGIISLNLNYGEVMEEIIALFLKYGNCRSVFSGSAGGYIAKNINENRPPIGSRIQILKSMNEYGETVAIDNLSSDVNNENPKSTLHLQIPSIFMETYEWLDHARKSGAESVDIETFYILRAIQNYNKNNPSSTVTGDIGCFVSDYVGEKPLREYSNVFTRYPEFLSRFLQSATRSILENPEASCNIIKRKNDTLLRVNRNFSFFEISPTFNAINSEIINHLEKINDALKQLELKDTDQDLHNVLFVGALQFIKSELIAIQKNLYLLRKGVNVKVSDSLAENNEEVFIKFPYTQSIQLCAKYVEIIDLYFRVKERFTKLGPNNLFFSEALYFFNTENMSFQDYLNILEKQDYIIAFHKLMSSLPSTSNQLVELVRAKENKYSFSTRTDLLKDIYKLMLIPFLFQTPRYRHHLEQDLLNFDVILFPTVNQLTIEDFLKYRPYNFFPLGISSNMIFADEFNLTPSDYFYHDAKHSLDMFSRNLVAYAEQKYLLIDQIKHFIKSKNELDKEIIFELQQLQLDEENVEKMKRAINLTLFEICHEEGYSYDFNGMIRALENPNPFYGMHIIPFLKEKLTTIYFFFPPNTKVDSIYDFPLEFLDKSKELLLRCLYKARKNQIGYKILEDGYWDITRGETQINPYQVLRGEHDYKTAHRKIGNINLFFKRLPKNDESFVEDIERSSNNFNNSMK